MDGIEMQSLTGGQPANVRTELANLQNAAKTVSGLSSRLRGAVNTPGFRAAAIIVASIATEQYVLQSLYFFLGQDNPLASGATPPIVVPQSDGEPQEWYINTVPGTSVKDFQAWIKTLPDKGLGRQYIYEAADFQSYVGKWTDEESIVIHENPIVSHQIPNKVEDSKWFLFQNNVTTVLEDYLQRRVDSTEIRNNGFSVRYLDILSLPKDKDISSLPDPNMDSNFWYLWEGSGGSGSTVYMFECGVNWNYRDFRHVTHEDYIVPSLKDEHGNPITDTGDQNFGHGTAVAGAVIGEFLGVAKRATFVSVKIATKPRWLVEDRLHAWRWAIEDVKKKNREGKAVFVLASGKSSYPNHLGCIVTFSPPASAPQRIRWNNAHAEYAYQAPYNIPRPAGSDPWVDLLAEAWKSGIVTVFAAGNKDVGDFQIGIMTPQRFATSNNALIMAGSIDSHGRKSSFNSEVAAPREVFGYSIDAGLVGEYTIYAHAEDILTADYLTNTDQLVQSGTSLAAPQIAGLAAYFLGLPNLRGLPSNFRDVPMAIKKHIRKTGRGDGHDGVGTAYNGVRELLCNQGVTTLQQKKRRSVEDAISLGDKLRGLLGLNITLAQPALIQDEKSSRTGWIRK
ncbi:MAG: hypothetical protein L6R38_007426 [Xanthoria sp. 2 TBL-2021]|nr:MAG: hypothetical protein L6R38_007426 [Xanthoria sp. 2 TBL-2021]